jgi:hypothetical protein
MLNDTKQAAAGGRSVCVQLYGSLSCLFGLACVSVDGRGGFNGNYPVLLLLLLLLLLLQVTLNLDSLSSDPQAAAAFKGVDAVDAVCALGTTRAGANSCTTQQPCLQ